MSDFTIEIEEIPGYISNRTIITCVVLMLFSWVTVGLRYYTRLFIVRSLGADDIWMGLALVLCTCFMILECILSDTVSRKASLTGDQMTNVTNILFAVEVFYVTSIAFLKVSLALFFLRILVLPWQRYIIYTTLVTFSAFTVVYFWYDIFQCGVPGNDFWLKKVTSQCGKESIGIGMGYTHAILTALSDLIFCCLPILVVRQSSMRIKEKITVIAIMVVATTGWIASLVRIKWVPTLWEVGPDYFYNGANLVVWSAVEPGLGVIAGSIATLRPLLRRIAGYSSSSTNTTLVSSNATEPKAGKFEMKNRNNIKFPLKKGNKNAFLETSDKTDGTPVSDDNRRASALKGKARNNGYDNDLEWGSGDTQAQVVPRREEQLTPKNNNNNKKKKKKKGTEQREGMPLGIFTTRVSDGGDSNSDSERGVRTEWYSQEELTEQEC